MMRHIIRFFIILQLLVVTGAYSAITVDASTRRISGSFSAYDGPYELTRTNVRLGSNNFSFDIVAGYQNSSRCIPATNATTLPAGCTDVRNGNQTQSNVTYSQVASFANQYINAGVFIPAGVNLNVVNTLIVCHGAVPRQLTVVRKCLSATLPAAVVEPPCTIGTASISINHGSLNTNAVSGHIASSFLPVECRIGQYISITPATTTNGVVLRSDGSLTTKITVNDSTQTNGGALVYVSGGGYALVKITSTLKMPYGYVTAGAFSGSSVLTINVI